MARGRAAVALWLAALALCAAAISQARFVADLSSFLPAAPTEEQRLLVEQLRDGAVSRVMLLGIEGADAPVRARLSNALADALRGDARFSSVANGAARGFERERDVLLAHRYALSPRVTPERFTVEGLRAAVADTIDLLASPAGMLVKPMVPRDPTGELVAVLEALRPAEGPAQREGAWASPDGRRALLVARTRAGASDVDAQAEALAAAQEAFARARSAVGTAAADARLLVTGPGVFSVRSRAMIEHDVTRLTGLGALLVVGLLLSVYRSPRALGLGLVPVLSGVAAGLAAVTVGFDTVHGITLGFGSALLGEAVDYSIYLFVQSERGERAGDPAWLAGFWPTIRLGVLTSIAGFSAMLLSGLPGLAQLGLYSIAGLAAAAMVTRFVLPALLPASFRIRDVTPFGERCVRLVAHASRARALVAVAVVAALAVLAIHRDRLWDPQISSLNPIPQEDRALDAELRAGLGASDARHMVAVRAATADEALAAAERVGARLDELVASGALGGYESPARFLPSVATQRARLAALPDGATLRTRLREALKDLPLRPERVEPFVEEVGRAREAPPLAREALAGTAFDAALDGLLFREGGGRWMAMIGLQPKDAARGVDTAAVRAALERSGARDAFLLDVRGEVDRLYAGYFRRALAMSALGFAAIVALLFLALRSPVRVLRVLAPLAAGVVVVAAVHVLAGTRLSLLHLVGLLLVVAIGSNYALFFDRLDVGGAAAPRTLASLVLANLTTVAGFGVLGFSSIPVLHAIGLTVGLGAVATLVFAAMLSAPSPKGQGEKRPIR